MRHVIRFAISAIVLSFLANESRAQDEVRWRYDYAAARGEAEKAGLPLLLSFSTEWCTYCKKLDGTTYRDPQVLKLLNEQYVPVKLDATKEKKLVEALQMQEMYPTMILAGPDGRIIRTIVGYVDAEKMHTQLKETRDVVMSLDWMMRDFDEALRLTGLGEFAAAVRLLHKILDDKGERPIQNQAKKLLVEIEDDARAKLLIVKQVEAKGDPFKAIDAFTAYIQKYAGTKAAADARTALNDLTERPEVKTKYRASRAAELLTLAKQDHRNQHYVCCLDRCSELTSRYSDLPEANEAKQILDQIKANPDTMKLAANNLADRLGEMYLILAEAWIDKGDPQLAAECLSRVITTLPGTRHAEVARARLAQLQSPPQP